MREIILTQGKVALVDDKDYDQVSQFKWYASRERNSWYAVRKICVDGKRHNCRMHRFILGLLGKELFDHINSDGLDNRRKNLRACTASQNQQNRRLQRGTSKYKGVCSDKRKWRASIMVNSVAHYLGLHNTH